MATTTTDHETIREWTEARGGTPAQAKGTGGDGEAGVLRLDFGEPDDSLEPISWDDFFAKFEDSELAFLYQDEPDNRFNKFVKR